METRKPRSVAIATRNRLNLSTAILIANGGLIPAVVAITIPLSKTLGINSKTTRRFKPKAITGIYFTPFLSHGASTAIRNAKSKGIAISKMGFAIFTISNSLSS